MQQENYSSIAKLFFSGALASDAILSNEYEIENLILILKDLDNKEDWLKQLKAKRIESITAEFNLIEQDREKIRSIILNSMKELVPDKKSLSFPGVGKVQIKPSKPKWVVEENSEVLEFLDKENKTQNTVITEKKIVKKELDKVLDEYFKANINVPGVKREGGKESLAVTIAADGKKKLEDNDLDSLDAA